MFNKTFFEIAISLKMEKKQCPQSESDVMFITAGTWQAFLCQNVCFATSLMLSAVFSSISCKCTFSGRLTISERAIATFEKA